MAEHNTTPSPVWTRSRSALALGDLLYEPVVNNALNSRPHIGRLENWTNVWKGSEQVGLVIGHDTWSYSSKVNDADC